MKMPREILLQKHQAAQPKLDQLRRAALRELERGVHAASAPRPVGFTFFLSQLWRELILPSRRIWSGLAAAWVVIILVNWAEAGPEPRRLAQAAPTTPETRLAIQAQRRWLSELLATAAEQPAEPPRSLPQPRSERRVEWKLA